MTLLLTLAAIVAGAFLTATVAQRAYRAGHEAAVGRVVASLQTLQQTIAGLPTAEAQTAAIAATAEQLEAPSEE